MTQEIQQRNEKDVEDEDDEKSDKNIRLTLLEEVILVGIKDKEVKF